MGLHPEKESHTSIPTGKKSFFSLLKLQSERRPPIRSKEKQQVECGVQRRRQNHVKRVYLKLTVKKGKEQALLARIRGELRTH